MPIDSVVQKLALRNQTLLRGLRQLVMMVALLATVFTRVVGAIAGRLRLLVVHNNI